MKKLAIILLCLLLTLTGCMNKEEVSSAVDTAMSVLKTGEGDPSACLADISGQPLEALSNDESVQLFIQKVQYCVLSVEGSGDTAAVELEITAPDGLSIITQAVSGMEELDEELMLANIAQILSRGQFDTLVFNVHTEAKKIDKTWHLVCNRELANALSGGLYEYQAAETENIKNTLIGD